ncbi:glycine cleavage system aminomethyltransferase T [Microbulbifer flavimaris]|uniref:aminomethyltransferase n=1 Tax=Microbulbifer flavimaris TaxID=1781068 RepID=A0ABX4I332_9GAMM|nr:MULTISPECIES: glycine cleavage system aminomethyltransferase GcvT [Microbulbifer]KUJ84496.1 glycine cleavage system protein T [Microbulbifer sp. ZGT114]PCO06583.1 glycine cleavage system aminomethyltransferase T [Microbulbifer flavimaris]
MNNELRKTPLYDLHTELGGKLVPFAGYAMPVQYQSGIVHEHLHTREAVGVFDVSHMGQLVVRGSGAAAGLEELLPIDIDALEINQQCYAVMTTEDGGILDDLIITRWAEDEFFLVVNAATAAADIAHLQKRLRGSDIRVLGQQALLAVQGPMAGEILGELSPAIRALTFMHGMRTELLGEECYITRSGYTGEDGFEISIPAQVVDTFTRKLLEDGRIQMIGLGARDTLRLEAGLCLYGADMDRTTSPVEAGLLWSIGKCRRPGGTKVGGFLGADIVLAHIVEGVSRRRVGFTVQGRIPVRTGTDLVDEAGNVVGRVTSGGYGPTLGAGIGMGYVDRGYEKAGTELQALVRGKIIPITVAKTPFVPQRYYRG